MVAVEVVGGARLRRTLRRAGVDVKRLTALNREAAETVLPTATSTAPRASGRLATTGRTGATTRAGLIRFGSKRLPYAGPIHYGWPARNIAPQPWATEAAQRTEGAWTDVYQQGIESLLASIQGK